MPIAQQQTIEREEFQVVVVEPDHVLRLPSGFLERSYFSADASGNVRVSPGLILAKNSTSLKYTPYSATVSYGPDSDTAVGILEVPEDATYDDPGISPVVHGKVLEASCYVYGATSKGSIPAAVKTALDDVIWI
jgi:hypothetical protein